MWSKSIGAYIFIRLPFFFFICRFSFLDLIWVQFCQQFNGVVSSVEKTGSIACLFKKVTWGNGSFNSRKENMLLPLTSSQVVKSSGLLIKMLILAPSNIVVFTLLGHWKINLFELWTKETLIVCQRLYRKAMRSAYSC